MAFISHCCREVKKILHPMVCNSITRKRRQIAKSNLPPSQQAEGVQRRLLHMCFIKYSLYPLSEALLLLTAVVWNSLSVIFDNSAH